MQRHKLEEAAVEADHSVAKKEQIIKTLRDAGHIDSMENVVYSGTGSAADRSGTNIYVLVDWALGLDDGTSKPLDGSLFMNLLRELNIETVRKQRWIKFKDKLI